MTAIPLIGGQFTVPGNRWDLLADMPARTTTVAVVIPYYNQQHDLDLVLTALEDQDYPADLVQIIVADDGSAKPPHTDTTQLPITVVRQQDRGFRAAAARNLGAAASDAEVLCFLDADTVPQRDYLRRIVALPSLCPEALVVGRRRHADFSGWTPARLRQWWAGGAPPVELDEPRWLSDEYTRSRDLLKLDHRSYRYVISAVMCCGTAFFREVGGFDESFRQYGGEDWEFAHRALIGGAVLKHDRDAVAWHNGPDWAGRSTGDSGEAKNAETLAVARLVPDPELRATGLTYDLPAVAVEIDASGHGPGSLLATIGCFLHLDVGVWIHGSEAANLVARLKLSDQRIRCQAVPEQVLRRCRHVITVAGRAVLPRSAVTELVRRCDRPGIGVVAARADDVQVVCSASWARNRALRWNSARMVDPAEITRFSSAVEVAAETVGLIAVDPHRAADVAVPRNADRPTGPPPHAL